MRDPAVDPGEKDEQDAYMAEMKMPFTAPLPWACATCGGWVNPNERVYTDEGLYHDRLNCLTEGRFKELVEKWGCKC